ncbi:hypothetical protein GCM10010349_46380 [Streptomyces flavofungini]|nr:hypothetical protein GCM10010349_46380 [Streptomyces flavofungini]
MKGRGASHSMTNQGIKLSQRCVHHASGPKKVTLTDVGWAMGGQGGLPLPHSRLEGGPVQ